MTTQNTNVFCPELGCRDNHLRWSSGLVFFAVLILTVVTHSATAQPIDPNKLPQASKPHEQKRFGAAPTNVGEYLDRLVLAYPDVIERFDIRYLYLRNGTKFLISDGNYFKTFEQLLTHPDIDDMFYAPYPFGEAPTKPPLDSDPGRVRFTPLFKAMYGDCSRGEVAHRLRSIKWLPAHAGGTVQITRSNGVDHALESVSAEIDRLPKDLAKYAIPSAGTYNCRNIAGTNNVSMHAFGAAIDINVKFANYWRWHSGTAGWGNRIPNEIIQIFEKHGFIWGGRWSHFDTMHFEYRPELLR